MTREALNGWLSKALPAIVGALFVALVGGSVAFYVRASIVEEEVSDLETRADAHDVAGHRSTAREVSDLRLDIGRLLEKVSASDHRQTARDAEMDRRLGRIERALER